MNFNISKMVYLHQLGCEQPRDLYFNLWISYYALPSRIFRDLFTTMVGVLLPDCFWCSSLQVMNRSHELWISPDVTVNNSLGSGSEVRGKAKKIGQWRERGSLGRDEDYEALRPSPTPQSTIRLASLADFFPVSSRFLPFPPTTKPAWSRANVIMVLQQRSI